MARSMRFTNTETMTAARTPSFKKTAFLCVIFFLAGLPAAFTETVYAVIERFDGPVYIKQTPESAWESVKEGMLLENGALIATGLKSFADIFILGTIVTVDALSRVVLEIPEDIELTGQGGGLLPVTGSKKNTNGERDLMLWTPVGAGGNTRVKVKPEGKLAVRSGETMDGPSNKAGFKHINSEMPRTVNLDVEIIWP